jgi:hypothetical protein
MECTGDIIVSIIDNGVPIGNIITIGMAGNTYMVIISNPNSGQSCMTNILVVDGNPPMVTCPDDITLECTADLSEYNGLSPGDITDCSATEVFIDDVLLSSGVCENEIISQYVRTYIVVDEFNNATTCEQLISLEKVDINDVSFPPHLIGVDALNCFPPPDTSPALTGIPEVNDEVIVNGLFCNLSVAYDDIVVEICSGSYKIFRTWTVYDWCDLSVTLDSTQIIEVLDLTGPVVQAPADMTISTGAQECNADVLIPEAVISEDCSDAWTVRMQGPFGTIHSNGGLVSDIPVGVHMIVFIATNDCNEAGMDTMVLTVEDLQPPVPVCHQTLAVPLNNIGTATIPASAFNAASQDNCGDVYFKVRRMGLPLGYTCANPGNPNNLFDDFIQFCCEDIANNDIMVILRVYDLPPVPGPVGDNYLQGHYNDCMVMVEVQDKLPPQITCPTDLTISCEFPFTEDNLEVFGSVVTDPADQEQICIDDPGVPGDPGIQCLGIDGLATDNCQVEVTTSAEININNCGLGTIIRTFTATDDGGLQASCQQVISVINYNPFDASDITWPQDYYTSNVCEVDLLDPEDIPAPYNVPVLNEGLCDLVASSYEDMVFDFTNDDQACFKILRTWTVIDWCQLNSPSGGTWTHLQVIKVMNTVAPVIEPLDDIIECSFDKECEGLTLDFEAEATDDCSGPASLSWKYSIDIDNNGTFDFVSPVQTGSSISFSFDFPIGDHRILYTVWDQCGNITTEDQLVSVESCTAPTPVCIHGLSTDLMPMDLDGDGTADWGMVTIQAEMFDASSYHSCGNSITFSFSADPLDVTRVFDCNDIGENEIEMWVIDENGLADFCITTIDIQDNNNVCPPGQGILGSISGNISVPGTGKLSNSMIYLDGSNSGGVPSGPNGYYVFPAMPFGGTYTVRPVKEGDAKNGVTTLDLVKIQKHLLGIESFTTPFQYIAADVNNSENITAIDIIQLRKLILGYYSELPNNQSWRFIDESHQFPDPANPWLSEWKETYDINPFSHSMDDINFNAVKIGDLNLSANLAFDSPIILPRSAEDCEIVYTVHAQNEPGVYLVELNLKDPSSFNAVQFSFDWDRTSFDWIEWTAGNMITNDEIRWPDSENQNVSIAASHHNGFENNSTSLLKFWIRAREQGHSKVKLYLKPGPTEPIAYMSKNDEGARISLVKSEDSPAYLYNKPNPFRDRTVIWFESTVDEEAHLTFYDQNGRIVRQRKVSLTKGENEFYVQKYELGNAGIYMYEIKSALQHSTNRMLIVE